MAQPQRTGDNGTKRSREEGGSAAADTTGGGNASHCSSQGGGQPSERSEEGEGIRQFDLESTKSLFTGAETGAAGEQTCGNETNPAESARRERAVEGRKGPVPAIAARTASAESSTQLRASRRDEELTSRDEESASRRDKERKQKCALEDMPDVVGQRFKSQSSACTCAERLVTNRQIAKEASVDSALLNAPALTKEQFVSEYADESVKKVKAHNRIKRLELQCISLKEKNDKLVGTGRRKRSSRANRGRTRGAGEEEQDAGDEEDEEDEKDENPSRTAPRKRSSRPNQGGTRGAGEEEQEAGDEEAQNWPPEKEFTR